MDALTALAGVVVGALCVVARPLVSRIRAQRQRHRLYQPQTYTSTDAARRLARAAERYTHPAPRAPWRR